VQTGRKRVSATDCLQQAAAGLFMPVWQSEGYEVIKIDSFQAGLYIFIHASFISPIHKAPMLAGLACHCGVSVFLKSEATAGFAALAWIHAQDPLQPMERS